MSNRTRLIITLSVLAIVALATTLAKRQEPRLIKVDYLCATPLGLSHFSETEEQRLSERQGFLVVEVPNQVVSIPLQDCIKVESHD